MKNYLYRTIFLNNPSKFCSFFWGGGNSHFLSTNVPKGWIPYVKGYCLIKIEKFRFIQKSSFCKYNRIVFAEYYWIWSDSIKVKMFQKTFGPKYIILLPFLRGVLLDFSVGGGLPTLGVVIKPCKPISCQFISTFMFYLEEHEIVFPSPSEFLI